VYGRWAANHGALQRVELFLHACQALLVLLW
jgi:hypothetical protein